MHWLYQHHSQANLESDYADVYALKDILLAWPAMKGSESIDIRQLVMAGELDARPSVEVPMNGR